MKEIHVECNPDETLVKKLGFTRKYITHHQGKAKLYNTIRKKSGELAIVDQDPGSARHPYEKELSLVAEKHGYKHYKDKKGNQVFELCGKLEDWILSSCKKQNITVSEFGLHNNAKKLHSEIHLKLDKFESLLDHLLEKDNPSITSLQNELAKLNK